MISVSSIIPPRRASTTTNQPVVESSTQTTGYVAKKIKDVVRSPIERRQPQLEKQSTSQNIAKESESQVVRPKVETLLADTIVNTTLQTVNSDSDPAMMLKKFSSEITSKLAGRDKGRLADNRTSQIPNKIREEIAQAKAKYELDAPNRKSVEEKENIRVAEARKAEAKLAQEAANAANAKKEADLVVATLTLDKNGIPFPPPPPPLPSLGDQTKLSPEPDNRAKVTTKPTTDDKKAVNKIDYMDELVKKLKSMNSHDSVVAENKTNKFTNKIAEEIAQAKAKYELDAPNRALAEKTEDDRVAAAIKTEDDIAAAIKAEEKLALEAVNAAKVKAELKAPLVYDENKIPFAPPLPPTA